MLNKIILFTVLALIMMFPALVNRFPLVFSDSGAYIASSIDFIALKDRPMGYGVFVHIFSWRFTLWPVIFVQSLLVVVLIWDVISYILKGVDIRKQYFLLVLTSILLSLFSSVSWYSSQIMPDIFIGLGAVALLMLIVKSKEEINIQWFLVYFLILFFAAYVHLSHIIILVLSLVLLTLKFKDQIKNSFYKYKLLIILGLFSIAVLIMSLNNYSSHSIFKPSLSTNVFLCGRFAESGILEHYVKEEICLKDSNHFLCEINPLPKNTNDFLWSKDGMMKHFKFDFIEANKSLNPIVNDILSNPKYLFPFLWDCSKNSVIQMFQLNIGSGLFGYRENTGPYYAINDNFWSERNYFLNSNQSFNEINFSVFNFLNYFAILLAILIVSYLIFYNLLKKTEIQMLFFLLFVFIFNAIVTASLANVYDRLQARISWPLILFVIVILIRVLIDLRKSKLL
jgi:hypothetical protein